LAKRSLISLGIMNGAGAAVDHQGKAVY